MNQFDEIDMHLLHELTKDSSISIPTLSEKMNVKTSVLYSRIKRLVRKGLIKKFTVAVDYGLLGVGVKASVGIKRDPKRKNAIHKSLMATDEVTSISEVTGRFDIMISIHAKNLDDLHSTVISKIGRIPGIQSTETLVELQKTEKDPTYPLKQKVAIIPTTTAASEAQQQRRRRRK